MKKYATRRGWVVIGLALGGLALVSCGTTRAAQEAAASAKISAQAERSATDMAVLDWKDRGIGEIAAPQWLLPAARGDWSQFKQTWKVDSEKILKLGVANNARQNVAMTVADVQYAARLANQLKQPVLTRAAISLGSDGEFDALNDAATKTLVNIAGQERLTDFWQKIEVTDEKGKKTTAYNYYVVYACDAGVWDQLVAKYLYDIIGVLPEKKTQQTMASLFKEIDDATKAEKPKTETEFRAELAAQQQALAKPLSPAERRDAYRSGNPAKAAAASTTPADTDYITALVIMANGQ
jgi:hypothetical protein